MSCPVCSSGNQAVFSAEMNVHLNGLNNLDDAGILIFPTLLVCLDCGSSSFTTPRTELSQLARGAMTGGPSNQDRSVNGVVPRGITIRA